MNRHPANSTPIDWTTDPGRVQGHFHSYATLMLAISPLETMAFLALGERLGGVFELSQASFGEMEDMVAVVDVDAFYHTEGALDGVTLAHVQQSETQQNVEIYRTGRASIRDITLWFRIHVRLPYMGDQNMPLFVQGLTTELPLFSHDLFDLSGTEFGAVSLKSTNCPMHVEFMTSDTISLLTNNAPIHGAFRTTGTARLETSNGPIIADTTLVGEAGEDSTTRVSLTTTNGPVRTNIMLAPTANSPRSPKFQVEARTSNGPVSASFATSEARAVHLDATVCTQNAPVSVALHPTFVGAFELQGFPFLPPVVREQSAGSGRLRSVQRTYAGNGVVAGRIAASSTARNEGKVLVQTSNGPLQLLV